MKAHDAQAFRLDQGYRAHGPQVMREMPSGEDAGRSPNPYSPKVWGARAPSSC